MPIASAAMPTGLSEHARKLSASIAYQTGPPAPRHPGRRTERFDKRFELITDMLSSEDGASGYRPAYPAALAGAPCPRSDVTIYPSGDVARRSATCERRSAERRRIRGAVERALPKAQVILEAMTGERSTTRPVRAPLSLTSIAGRVLVKEVNWLGDL